MNAIKGYAEEEGAQGATAGEETYGEKMVKGEIKPGSITIDFKDADIRTVLRVLSEKSGVNVVAGKDVEGYITIRLTNVPWEKALNIICKNYGYAFEREENIIRVTTIENLQQEELATEVFSLNYAKASEVADAIKEMLTDRGKDKIKYDERTNVLIVTDIPTNIYKIRQVIEKLDMKTPQVLIETRILETTLSDDERLGIDWNLKLAAVGAARPTTLPFTFAGALTYLGIDVQDWNNFMPRVEGNTEVSIDSTEAGAVITETITSEFPIGITGLDITQAHDSPFPTVDSSAFTFGTLDFTQFSMVLELLKARTDTDIISNPRIATLNNQNASIHIGTIIAIPTFERNPDTGTIEITGYSEKDLGIKLSVTPHVNEQGDIVVDLKPEISDLIRYDTLDAARGIIAPIYSTREAETQVMVKDGETIMLGGLLKEKAIDYKKKVPFLGDIPMLGEILFTKTEESISKTELIIFMTVHMMENGPAGSGTTLASSSVFVPISEEKQ
jgi:type IV pilus assembly protein PilQ